METWCTVAEASDITNETLTTGDLVAASSLLEIWVGVTPEAREKIRSHSARDLRLLKKAEAYQAAWMKSKPELLGRSDVDQVIQDTLQFSKGDADTHVLAPLAKAAIVRLSWRNNRTVDPLTADQALLLRGKFTAETRGKYSDLLDDLGIGWDGWEPL